MASINDYFNIDDKHNITVHSESEFTDADGNRLPIRIFQSLAFGGYYFSIKIPSVENPFKYCMTLLQSNLIEALKAANPKLIISSKTPTFYPVNTDDLKFCGRIFIYSESDLKVQETIAIHQEGLKEGLFVEYFGPSWAKERSEVEKPLAFISHDSRDKQEIARPLALRLSSIGVPVWFDEFSLKIGDSLRETIESGLKETDYCIIIISKNFLTNEGWTKTEFNSIFTREILQKQKIILPIWHEVSAENVYEYCPSLVDRFAANWSEGKEQVANKIKNRIRD